MLTKNITALKNANTILALAREIERSRDDIVYGAPLPNDRVLREKIEIFLELKKKIKHAAGELA